MIKLILLDLDGTLMSPNHLTVSEANKTALRRAHDMGVKIGICTGRTLAIMGDVCEQVPEVDYVIYSNGAGVFDRNSNTSIYTNLIPWSESEGIIDYVMAHNAFIEIYLNGKSYVQLDRQQYFGGGILPQEFIDSLIDKLEGCEDVKEAVYGKDLEKITLYPEAKPLQDEMWAHFCELGDTLSLASSLPCSMEVTKKGVDKGEALKSMCEILGITPDECMAFGDAGNDIPMLKYASFSFAMANASDECKAAAKYETKSNAEDGVAWAINKYVLNN